MTERKAGRKSIPRENRRIGIVFALTPSESDQVDRLVKKLGLRSRSALIQMLIRQEASR